MWRLRGRRQGWFSLSHRTQRGAAITRLALAVAVLLALVPAASSAKTLVYGVRTFKPPPSSVSGAFQVPTAPPTPVARFRRRRLLATLRPGAYRATALRLPMPERASLAHASAAGLYVGPGFPGLVDNGYWPSDAQVAVGPSDVVEMTNTMVGVYIRWGFRLAQFPMGDILGPTPNSDLSDPQIAWDQESGRWIAAAMDLSADTTNIAVSNTADPLGGWVYYTFPFGSTLCPDQPRLGFSSTVIVVTTELFYGNCHSSNSGGEQGAVMLVVDKQALLAEVDNPAGSQYGPSADYAHYVPVQMLAPSPIDYIASTDEGTSNVVHVFELQNVPPNDTLTEQDSLLIHPLMNASPAIERGGSLVYADDNRIHDASWRNRTLYLTADDSCTYPNDPYLETCARLMEISTEGSLPTLTGENDIGFPNGDAYYAAIRPDAYGNAIVEFDYSDPSDYPSIAATAAVGPIVGEQGGNFTQPVALAEGTSPTVGRWGDYSGTAVDPTNPSVVWTVGQVADDIGGPVWRWATHVDSVSLSSAIPAQLSHEVDPGYLYKGQTHQRERITIRPSGGGGHVTDATVAVRLDCRRHRSDRIIFELVHEGPQTIGFNGRFTFRRSWGPDQYATWYYVALTGTFTSGGRVSGTVSAGEHNRTLGTCRARNMAYSIHD